VCHPDKKGKVFVLPRDSDDIFPLPDSMEDIVTWFYTAGVVIEDLDDWTFEPFDSSDYYETE
jgi:hypothetical protein